MAVVFRKEDNNDENMLKKKIEEGRFQYAQHLLIIFLLLYVTIMLGVILTMNKDQVVGKVTSYITDTNASINYVSRTDWNATSIEEPMTKLALPVPYIIIMHTATMKCIKKNNCSERVRQIQKFHTKLRHFYDIAYNFLIGGDGCVYEGRGWNIQGAHTQYYNSKSIGISFIGNYNFENVSNEQILQAQLLIKEGIKLGYIDNDYKLFGAKQLTDTSSPGELLFEEIKKWPHWSKTV